MCSTRMAAARACTHCCKDSFHFRVMVAPSSSERCSTQRRGATVAHRRACCRSSRALRKALQTKGRQMPVLCSRNKYNLLGARDTAKSEVLQQSPQRHAAADGCQCLVCVITHIIQLPGAARVTIREDDLQHSLRQVQQSERPWFLCLRMHGSQLHSVLSVQLLSTTPEDDDAPQGCTPVAS